MSFSKKQSCGVGVHGCVEGLRSRRAKAVGLSVLDRFASVCGRRGQLLLDDACLVDEKLPSMDVWLFLKASMYKPSGIVYYPKGVFGTGELVRWWFCQDHKEVAGANCFCDLYVWLDCVPDGFIVRRYTGGIGRSDEDMLWDMSLYVKRLCGDCDAIVEAIGRASVTGCDVTVNKLFNIVYRDHIYQNPEGRPCVSGKLSGFKFDKARTIYGLSITDNVVGDVVDDTDGGRCVEFVPDKIFDVGEKGCDFIAGRVQFETSDLFSKFDDASCVYESFIGCGLGIEVVKYHSGVRVVVGYRWLGDFKLSISRTNSEYVPAPDIECTADYEARGTTKGLEFKSRITVFRVPAGVHKVNPDLAWALNGSLPLHERYHVDVELLSDKSSYLTMGDIGVNKVYGYPVSLSARRIVGVPFVVKCDDSIIMTWKCTVLIGRPPINREKKAPITVVGKERSKGKKATFKGRSCDSGPASLDASFETI